MSAPTALNQQVIERYVQARRVGANNADCAHYAGVHPSTVILWRNRLTAYEETGKDPTPKSVPPLELIAELFDADKRAKADYKVELLALIQQAARAGTWQAAAWKLERGYQDEFSLRHRVEVTHLSEDVLDAEIMRLQRQLAENDA